MKRKLTVLFVVVFVALLTVVPVSAGRGNGALGTIYVTSQGLYYDTFVTNDPLPMQGPFQKLENDATEIGPGDPGYLGGRWWEDTNGNNIMEATDHYFHCLLLGPGRTMPYRKSQASISKQNSEIPRSRSSVLNDQRSIVTPAWE